MKKMLPGMAKPKHKKAKYLYEYMKQTCAIGNKNIYKEITFSIWF